MNAENKQGVTVEVTKSHNTPSQSIEPQLVGDVVKLGVSIHGGLRGSGVPPLLLHPANSMRRDHSKGQNETHDRAKPRSTARKRHSFEVCLFCCQISSGCLVTSREIPNINTKVRTTTVINALPKLERMN